MADIYKLITLTEKNDSGPYFDAFYSTDCLTYTQSVDGNNIYLPSISSTAVITVPEETQCIKLQSIPEPCSNFVISGSGITTTTTTLPITTTTTTVPITTTTTTIPITTTTTTIPVTTTTTTTLAPRYWRASQCSGDPDVQLRDLSATFEAGDVVKFSGGGEEFCATLIVEETPFIWFTITEGAFLDCTTCLAITTTTTTTQPITTTTTTAPITTTTTTTESGTCRNIWVNDLVDSSRYGLRYFLPNVGQTDTIFSNLFGTPYNLGGNDGVVYSVCSTIAPQTWDSVTNTLVDLGSQVVALSNGGSCQINTQCEFVPPSTTTTTTVPVTTTTTTEPVTTTTTTAPVTTTTTTVPGCYTYSIQNNDLSQTFTYQYIDCEGVLIQDNIVLPDSGTPDFCAQQGSVTRQSGTFNWVLTLEATTCTVVPTTTTTTSTTQPVTTTTTTTTTIAEVCNCITVDVLNTQLTNGGLDLYYIVNDCGGGARDVNLNATLGTEYNGSTYFGLCSRTTLSNLFKYGPSGTPFVGIEGMNVTPNGTVCTIDVDCLPVVPTTTTTTTTQPVTTTTTTISGNYKIADCGTGLFYNMPKDYPFSLSDVVQYVRNSEPDFVYCGTIVDLNFGGIADATLWSGNAYACDDFIHCDFSIATTTTTTTTTAPVTTTTTTTAPNFIAEGNYGVAGYSTVEYDVAYQFTGMTKLRTLFVGPSVTCNTGCSYSAYDVWSNGASGDITVTRVAPDSTADDLGDISINLLAGSATISGEPNPKIFTSGTTINYTWNISNISDDAIFQVVIYEG